MITREDIRELAQFQGDGTDCAISFYFQPSKPRNKSHREDAILAKDLVRQALREAEKSGRNGCARADLQRILDLAARWSGNQARAKGGVRLRQPQDLARVRFAATIGRDSAVRQSPLSSEATGSGSGCANRACGWRLWIVTAPASSICTSTNLKNAKPCSTPYPVAVAATDLRVTTPDTPNAA